MTTEPLPDLLPRIRHLAAETADALDAYELLRRQRDELIVQAVDNGVSQREVAHAAGVSKGRITQLLANTTIHEEV